MRNVMLVLWLVPVLILTVAVGTPVVVDALLTAVVVAAAGAISIAEIEDVVAVVDMLATVVVDPDGNSRTFSFFPLLFSIPFPISIPISFPCVFIVSVDLKHSPGDGSVSWVIWKHLNFKLCDSR
jgi:hypothetical protein